ncbi:unnamed protein product [marine sediment metagenome]|uniref:Uncharacterized protein n=1 Tax=marine sediment metagenome TaxID=412755 RepID=X1DH20_9ZZZZ
MLSILPGVPEWLEEHPQAVERFMFSWYPIIQRFKNKGSGQEPPQGAVFQPPTLEQTMEQIQPKY